MVALSKWGGGCTGTVQARKVLGGLFHQQGHFETNWEGHGHSTGALPWWEPHSYLDNATTHLKWPDDALSAQNIPKFTPKEGTNWGPETTIIGENGKPVYGPNRKVVKIKIHMADATFANRTPQNLYFPPGHSQAGVFKGMSTILQERGLLKEANLKAQCKDFKCKTREMGYCCWRVLYSQPDFICVESKLETICKQ